MNSYSTDIFKDARFSDTGSQYATLAMGAMNIPMYILELPLIEIVGRKTLLLLAYGGLIVDTVLLTISLYFAVSFIFMFLKYFCIDSINRN